MFGCYWAFAIEVGVVFGDLCNLVAEVEVLGCSRPVVEVGGSVRLG